MFVSRHQLLCFVVGPYSHVLALATVLIKVPICLPPHANCVAILQHN